MDTNIRWWGWGTLDRAFPEEMVIRVLAYLQDELGFELTEQPPVSLASIGLPELRVKPEVGRALLEFVDVKTNKVARITHALGKSYPDLWRLRRGEIPNPPDLVAYPQSAGDIIGALQVAARHDISVTPFGGGTSVVGGVEPLPLSGGAISLDLRRMSGMLHLDRISRLATFEAGIRGPEMEAALNSRGFSLGHFPQSFEYSTLGGWVATRSAGQNSTLYGGIEDMVESLTVIAPEGEFVSRSAPSAATGPSLRDVFIGSEGMLGVISQVQVRVQPIPPGRLFRAALLPDWESGLSLLQSLIQADIRPSVVRLSDGPETELALRTQKSEAEVLPRTRKRLRQWVFEHHGLELGKCCLLILIFDGSHLQVEKDWARARRFLDLSGALGLGAQPARNWWKMRFNLPFLRDDLMSFGVMVDTLETAAPWSRLRQVYHATSSALTESLGQPGHVSCHVSHVYPDGASLYFTFMTPQHPAAELDRWQAVKAAATQALLEAGGTLSHHHGIGQDHAPWLQEEIGGLGVSMLQALKKTTDPQGILNPGKLLAPQPDPGPEPAEDLASLDEL